MRRFAALMTGLLFSASGFAGSEERLSAAFARAQKEHRFVIIDLGAVWCHWCHVMEKETYGNPEVRRLIDERFILLHVDQDADPELANRYAEYGWPATIVLTSTGSEIVRRRGYMPPAVMTSLLEAIIRDPSPGPSVVQRPTIRPVSTPHLDAETRKRLERLFHTTYDYVHGGWGKMDRFLQAAEIEWALIRAGEGDTVADVMARTTLDANLCLLDPVEGGVFQYSDRVDWSSPHYEKIMSFQADNIRLYALAFARHGDRRYIEAAKSIARYLLTVLRDPKTGAFFTSQDADVSLEVPGKVYYASDAVGRRHLGRPRVDENKYARENGWVIRALASLAEVSGESEWLEAAVTATRWIEANRRIEDGGFQHGDLVSKNPHLADSLAMLEGYLALHRVTQNAEWANRARETATFIWGHFRADGAGFLTRTPSEEVKGVLREPVLTLEENTALARAFSEVFAITQDRLAQQAAEHALRFVFSPDHVRSFTQASILVADWSHARRR